MKQLKRRTTAFIGICFPLLWGVYLHKQLSPGHEFVIIENDGVTTCISRNAQKFTADIFKYEFIGYLEIPADDDRRIDDVSYCVINEAGNVYVADRFNRRISIYDPSGHFQHIFGRQGSGPGEFRSFNGLAILNGDIVAADQILQRVSLFKSDGTFIESVRFPFLASQISSLSYLSFQAYPIDDGVVLMQQAVKQVDERLKTSYRASVVSHEGDEIASVVSPLSASPGPFTAYNRVKYAPGNGIIHENGTEGYVEVYSERGQLVRIIRLEVERVPISRAERNKVITVERERIEQADNMQYKEALQDRLDSFEWPPYKALWLRFHLDELGYGWAQHPEDLFEAPAWSTPYRIFSPEGEYLGDTELPQPSTERGRLFIGYGRVVYSYDDYDTGDTTVEMYRIRSAIPGFSYPH